MSGRIACLVVPLFSLAARLRSEPDLAREALAIVEGNGNTHLVAATRLARTAGVKPGQTVVQARVLCPRLLVRSRDGESERAAQEALLEVAEGFSPRVEDAGGGTAYLDVDGLDRHYPGLSPELDLGRALLFAASAAGLPARAGIASSKVAARVAAGLPESPVIVPRGEEASFLAPLPLHRLCREVEIAVTLGRWGLRSIGDLARLPPSRLTSRLGQAGRELHALARGTDPRPLIPREPPLVFHEGMSFEWPLVSLEPFLFVGRAALDRLCQRLEARGLACVRLGLELQLEPDGHQSRAIALPAPTRDSKTLLTLVRLNLEARPPGAPIAGLAFLAHPDRPREAQLSLYGPAALSPEAVATTLGRLVALLGPDHSGSPRPVDSHLPESFSLVEFVPPPPPRFRPEPRTGRGLLAVRVLRPPIGIEVLTAGREGAHEHLPVEIRSMADSTGARRLRVEGEVKVASGPWRLEQEWWSPEPIERDYWDVELAGHGLYRIYRERGSGDWYADGIYD